MIEDCGCDKLQSFKYLEMYKGFYYVIVNHVLKTLEFWRRNERKFAINHVQ